VYPLLDETRAQLGSCMKILSSSPYAQVVSLEQKLSRSYGRNHYVVKTDTWKNRSSGHGKELNKTLFGDIFILADFKPKNVNDLTRSGNMWSFLLSVGIPNEEIKEDDHDDTKIMSTFKVIASKDIDIDEMGQKSLFMIFLMNITSSRRIWNALHMDKHSNLIEKISLAFNMVR
jgi:senataxin